MDWQNAWIIKTNWALWKRIGLQNHRMAGLERTSRITKLQHLHHTQGHQPPHFIPAQAAQGHIQPGLQHLHVWMGHPQPLWAAVPAPHHSLCQQLPPHIQPQSALLQLQPISPCPALIYHSKQLRLKQFMALLLDGNSTLNQTGVELNTQELRTKSWNSDEKRYDATFISRAHSVTQLPQRKPTPTNACPTTHAGVLCAGSETMIGTFSFHYRTKYRTELQWRALHAQKSQLHSNLAAGLHCWYGKKTFLQFAALYLKTSDFLCCAYWIEGSFSPRGWWRTEQVAQGGCGCPIPAGIQGQAGCCLGRAVWRSVIALQLPVEGLMHG